MVSRETHTAIWKVRHRQQAGFYATLWHSAYEGTDPDNGNGNWEGSFGFSDSDDYDAGDPFLTYVANAAGNYYIVVRDGRFSAASSSGGDYELQGTVD